MSPRVSQVGYDFEILHGCYEANNTSSYWGSRAHDAATTGRDRAAVWLSTSLASFKSPQTPRPGPATGYHATTPPHYDLRGGTEGDRVAGPLWHGVAPKTSQDHSWGRGLAGLTLP
ncbi:hypothetical protein DHEL01_v201780 [Diaporthe helianthi]|uniref:Uncharacterized protein n=1 Tax=Diaporthe helianthi TaxID=158607 RepID=A0A2P5IBF2_DIAHE|nr:hypothetical protein DHEL01_v201780 [Diaporthe helianthi]